MSTSYYTSTMTLFILYEDIYKTGVLVLCFNLELGIFFIVNSIQNRVIDSQKLERQQGVRTPWRQHGSCEQQHKSCYLRRSKADIQFR